MRKCILAACFAAIVASALFVSIGVENGNAQSDSQRAAGKKPLAGYTVLLVEKFTVEKTAATQEFPGGQEVVMQKSSVARLREKMALVPAGFPFLSIWRRMK